MKISIIVPVYNVEKYIVRCLESVMAQSYPDIECIVVNDCTPDSSFEIARKLVENYNGPVKFKLVEHSHNMGLSAARNTGVRHSSGDYLYFLDSDDAITEDAIQSLANSAVENSLPEIVMGYTQGVDASGNYVEVASEQFQSVSFHTNVELFNAYLRGTFYPIACNKLIRCDIFDVHGTYFREGITHEDIMWSFEISTYVNSVVLLDKTTYLYYIGDSNSISRSRLSEKRVEDSLSILEVKASYIGKTCNDSLLSSHIKDNLWTLMYVLVRYRFKWEFICDCMRRVRMIESNYNLHAYKVHVPFYIRLIYRLLNLCIL